MQFRKFITLSPPSKGGETYLSNVFTMKHPDIRGQVWVKKGKSEVGII